MFFKTKNKRGDLRLRKLMIEDLIRKAAKEYFENISRDEFISDLGKAGFTVYEADQD